MNTEELLLLASLKANAMHSRTLYTEFSNSSDNLKNMISLKLSSSSTFWQRQA